MVWSNCLYPPPRIIVSTTPSWAEWLASSFTEKARYLPVFVHQFIGNLAWHTAKSTSNSFGSETAYHVHYESRIVGLDYAVLNVSSPLAGFRVKPEMILRVIRNFSLTERISTLFCLQWLLVQASTYRRLWRWEIMLVTSVRGWYSHFPVLLTSIAQYIGFRSTVSCLTSYRLMLLFQSVLTFAVFLQHFRMTLIRRATSAQSGSTL